MRADGERDAAAQDEDRMPDREASAHDAERPPEREDKRVEPERDEKTSRRPGLMDRAKELV